MVRKATSHIHSLCDGLCSMWVFFLLIQFWLCSWPGFESIHPKRRVTWTLKATIAPALTVTDSMGTSLVPSLSVCSHLAPHIQPQPFSLNFLIIWMQIPNGETFSGVSAAAFLPLPIHLTRKSIESWSWCGAYPMEGMVSPGIQELQ